MNIGIDLGTTNSALAWAESGADGSLEMRVLDVPQFVAQGRKEVRRTLPSFLYLGDQEYIGVYAREQGALVPPKCVHSAKSWLSNPDVDRTAKILPWDAQPGGRVLSPVDVSTRTLAHLADAWKQEKLTPLSAHNVVLTVPASFDAEARELTAQAARDAGITQLTLLEEPAAAFYSWIAHDLARSRKNLFDGQTVLICDVGGGTSDFTVIRVNREGDRIDFTRTAVGRHLLLGGDNLDLTLSWLVESKLGKTLSLRQRSALRRQCAAAKEKLLGGEEVPSVEITVLGAGSSLVGGTLKCEISREEVLELALEGFLPICEASERPQEEQQSPFRELGLPYVTDPAVTRHLAAFLAAAGENGGPATAPDAILFNGGFFIPQVLRQRVADSIEHWYGKRPQVFEHRDLDLAVATGAAYYAHVRATGEGLVVRGGLPRAYFIAVGGAAGSSSEKALCLVPRGTEEGATVELDPGGLQLVANKPVAFRLFSSRLRTADRAGDLIELPREQVDGDPHRHAPLNAVLRFGKAEARAVPVTLGARLSEVGTLEIWVQAKDEAAENRWRLQFDLRDLRKDKGVEDGALGTMRAAAVISEQALAAATELIARSFAGDLEPQELPSLLEQALCVSRTAWPLDAIRKLADAMIEHAAGRGRSAAHELRWLNLCGFCLRPGFGFPGDELRMEGVRSLLSPGLQFANQVQNQNEWWIFWNRAAGGLSRQQQVGLFQQLSPQLLPRGEQRPPRLNSSLVREMWRAAASLELLPIETKTRVGDACVDQASKGDLSNTPLWCISRIGARKLFYGPINQVVPAGTAARWVEKLLKVAGSQDAVASLARITGDGTRDLPAHTLELVRRAHPSLNLEAAPATDLAAMGRVFGEDLPLGLLLE